MDLVLDANGIDQASEAAYDFLKDVGMDHREALAGKLSFENTLIILRQELGDSVPATMSESRLFARPRLIVSVRGKRFNPLVSDKEDGAYAIMARSLFESSGLRPTYAYLGGHNIIILSRPRTLSSLAQIVIAFILGVVVSAMGLRFISEAARTYLLDTFINPLFNLYLGMLGGIAGPLVFLSVAWGVCGIGDAATLGRSGMALIMRFLKDNFLSAVLAALICIPVFALPTSAGSSSSTIIADLMTLVIGLFPTNFLTPFVEGNTVQIILIGSFVGTAALMLGNACIGVRSSICELNSLAQFLMEQLCRFIPGFIFIMVIAQIWSGTYQSLLSGWLPLLLISVLSILILAVRLVFLSIRHRVPIGALYDAMHTAIMLGLTTASSSAAFGAMVSTCKDDLGVGEEQVSFGLPLGVVICQPSTAIEIVVLILFCMQSYGLGADTMWYIRLTLVAFLYSMVAPPVPGGMIVCFGLILAELGVPAAALTLITAFDAIVDYVVTAVRVGFMMIEVYDAGCALDKAKEKGA